MECIVKAMTDTVATIVARWREERPDLDPTPMLVVGRIQRLAHMLDVVLRPPFAEAGLGPGDFDVLAALRRSGSGFSRTPKELRGALMVTQGAVTKQVDRLLAKGLVTRDVSPDDARGRTITLTDAGVTLIDELIAVHLENERQALSVLSSTQIADLGRLLGVLAEDLEAADA
jgi:DNA-binding MarR family transcriptional regulator